LTKKTTSRSDVEVALENLDIRFASGWREEFDSAEKAFAVADAWLRALCKAHSPAAVPCWKELAFKDTGATDDTLLGVGFTPFAMIASVIISRDIFGKHVVNASDFNVD
jgi:hypothetical protein